MLTLQRIVVPATLQEAYELYQAEDSVLLAGATLYKLFDRQINTGIEIAHLLPGGCFLNGDRIRIGPMTTLREMEMSPLFAQQPLDILTKAVAHLGGVQLRNVITAGGTVAAGLGTSEFVTALLALNARVLLYKAGEMALEEYFAKKRRDILMSIEVAADDSDCKAAIVSMRHSFSDATLLHTAVMRCNGMFRIAVGARPQRAALCPRATRIMLQSEEPIKAAQTAAQELDFGDDLRASADYRRQICAVLVRRAIEEVFQ